MTLSRLRNLTTWPPRRAKFGQMAEFVLLQRLNHSGWRRPEKEFSVQSRKVN